VGVGQGKQERRRSGARGRGQGLSIEHPEVAHPSPPAPTHTKGKRGLSSLQGIAKQGESLHAALLGLCNDLKSSGEMVWVSQCISRRC